MPAKSDTFEYNHLRLTFTGVAISTLAATAGTTTLWLGLHTATPGAAGSTAAEGGYAQYTRIATQRSTAADGWTITSGTSDAVAVAQLVNTMSFPQNTSTSTGTHTHASVWMSSAISSSGMLYYGTISPNLAFQQNSTPQLTSGTSITES